MRFCITVMASVPVNITEASTSTTVPWTLGDAARATALAVGVIVLLVLLTAPVIRMFGGPEGAATLLLLAILQGTLLLGVWRFGPWKYGLSWRALGLQAGFSNGAGLALLVFLVSVGFVLLYSLAVSVLGLKDLAPPPLPGELMATYPQRIAVFSLTVLAAPLVEEVFFRGFLLPVFVGRWGFVWGAGFVSLVFSMSHGVPGLLVPAFVTGMLLAWLYRRTGSLWNCCLAHGAQNALAFAVVVSV